MYQLIDECNPASSQQTRPMQHSWSVAKPRFAHGSKEQQPEGELHALNPANTCMYCKGRWQQLRMHCVPALHHQGKAQQQCDSNRLHLCHVSMRFAEAALLQYLTP